MTAWRLVLATAAACALWAQPAGADVLFDFETPALNECTSVGTQFSGIEFVTGQAVEGYPNHLPYVMTAGATQSGVRSLQTGVGCSYEPGTIARTALRVAQTRASVSMYVRQDLGGGDAAYQLRALDAGGTRVDTNGDTYQPLPANTNAYTKLTAATADNTNRIATVQLVPQSPDQNVVLRLDDVELVDGAGGTVPDFSMGPSPPLVIPQGGSGTVIVPVTRYNGSDGYRTDTLTDVPSGVTAFATPNYSHDAARIQASASLDAPTGSRPPLTITGTGGPEVGPGPRSAQIPVTITPTLPSVSISVPVDGELIERVPFDLRVSGSFNSPRANPSLCAAVTQSGSVPAMPEPCNSATPSGTSDNYVLTVSEGFAPGINFVHVFLRDSGGYVATATRSFRIADESTGIDLRISGIEVTQGAQRYSTLGGLAIPRLSGMNTVEYGGVQLVADHPTYVRVFATTNQASSSHGVSARLRVTRNGVEIPGSPFLPQNGPRPVTPGALYTTDALRRDIAKGYFFALPPAAARGPLVLDAVINDDPIPILQCPTCRANDEMRVTNVRFRPMKTLHIYPIRFTDNSNIGCPDGSMSCPGRQPQGDVVSVFARARAMFPFHIALHTWVADMDITQDQITAAAAIARWDADHPTPGPSDRRPRNDEWIVHRAGNYESQFSPPGTVVGVGRGSYPGMNYETLFCCNPLRIESFDVVEEQRPLTSVAHEYGHAVGLAHADRGPNRPDGATGSDNNYGCAGGGPGQRADGDWPDLRGTLVGFAYDPLERVVIPAFDAAGNAAGYDFMSYCAGEGNSWISSRNWDRLVNERNDGGAVRAAARQVPAGPSGPGLAVGVRLDPDGSDGIVTNVQPVDGGAVGSDPAGTYELTVVGGDGAAISSTSVVPRVVHVDAERGPETSLAVAATVPSSVAARALELRRKDGAVVARREATPTAPEVRLLAPRPGTRVGRRGTLLVRWKGTDRDDGDTLRYTVDQATSPGGAFRTVGDGYTGSSARIPVSLLRPTANGRLRVRVLDGFREGSAVSGRLWVATRPPDVDIVEPARDARVRADAVLTLEGQATDAKNELVPDRRLTWRLGKRVIGKGASASATGLPPGLRRITLTAQDSGLRGRASVRVRVLPVTPRLLSLKAPASVPAKARLLRIAMTASVSGRVVVSGSGARGAGKVGRVKRSIRVRIPAGSRVLALRITLRGGGGKAVVPVTVSRR